MLLDGEAPKDVHTETFGAMMAIMLGAAETVTSTSQGNLKNVTIELTTGNLVVMGAGQRILLACFVSDKERFNDIVPFIEEAARRLRTLV